MEKTLSDEGLFPGFDVVLEQGRQTADPSRIVGRTVLVWKQRRSVLVSTVLLPWADTYSSPPYESLVSGDVDLLPRPLNSIGWSDIGGRYWTREDAEIGHKAWCRMVAGWLTHAGRHTVTWRERTTWEI